MGAVWSKWMLPMIATYYIEVNSIKKSISLSFRLLSAYKNTFFSIWFYPEATQKKREQVLNLFHDLFLKDDYIKPVTYYEEEKKGLKTNKCFSLNNISKRLILENIDMLNRYCDSILFYNEESVEWEIACIFHEKILLSKENKLITKYLINHKINFSDVPPKWW